ncbi:MAG: 16S rRNA (guanine(966)-N(2))-methyltransferase RsmD [Pseudomonadota bacterium]
MRIVGGHFKGRRIAAAKGDISRPTTDRNREALFNILTARDDVTLEGARVIDLFAGSGALGLEAMSRGAGYCLFVEIAAPARGAIRDNIEALNLFGQTRIHRRSAAALGRMPASAGGPFALAFLDPPYRKNLAPPALRDLAHHGWLAPDAVVVLEQARDEVQSGAHGDVESFEQIDQRTYGDTHFSLLRFIGAKAD